MKFNTCAGLLSLLLFAGCLVQLSTDASADVFSVPYSPTSPTIDGVSSVGEWGAGNTVTMNRIDGGGSHESVLYFQHDNSSLFIGIDSQWGTGFDVVWNVSIDGDDNDNLNGNLTPPYVDVNSARSSPTGWSGYNHYRTLPSIGTEVNVGFGTGAASASGGSSNVFYEFLIPLADLNVSPGDAVGFLADHGIDGVADHQYYLSTAGTRSTPEQWDTLHLLVPEPATICIAVLGCLGMVPFVHRERRRA